MKSIITSAVAALCISSAMADSITVVSWGGAYTTSQVESMHKPFEQKSGVKVISSDYEGGLGEIAAQVKTGNVKWDVADVEGQDVLKGCDEGLFERIDASKLPVGADGTPAAKDFANGTVLPCAVGTIFSANVFAYDRSKLGANAPKSLNDFFDTKKIPGKRGMRKNIHPTLEWALMADGVAAADVYKVLGTQDGIDRAFRKLDTIKKDIVWWTAGAQPPQLLASGEVVMAHSWHGRIVDAAQKEKKDFAIVWDGQTYAPSFFAIVKGSKNVEAAQEFVRSATGTQSLADQSKYIAYAPVRKSSMAKIPDSNPNKVWLPGPTQSGRSLLQDPVFMLENNDNLTKRFNAWLAK